MSKTKVLFFGKLPPPYIGPAVATHIILNSALRERFELVHFDISHHKSFSDLGKYSWRNIWAAVRLYFKLIVAIIQEKPQIVYLPSQQTNIAYLRDVPFVLISKLMGRKVVCQLRGGYFKNWYNETVPPMRWLVRRIQALIDGQMVLGENLRHLYSDLMPDDRIFVVPNGGNYAIPAKNADHNTIDILFLGNFIESKGVLDVLRAATLLPEFYWPKVRFLFAGNWRDEQTKNTFEEIVADHPGLPVTIVGPVYNEDKFQLLANSDVFVFPSFYRNEGHPWVIVEAMAAGLPIISTDHAAIAESVTHEQNGFLVEKRKPAEIARRICALVDDPSLRNQMAAASRQHYEAGFTEASLVDNFANAFTQVAKR